MPLAAFLIRLEGSARRAILDALWFLRLSPAERPRTYSSRSRISS